MLVDNRNLALLIGVGGVLVICLLQQNTRPLLLQLVRTALHPVLVTPLTLLAVWVTGLILASRAVGLWIPDLTPDAAIWFVGTAVAILFEAVDRLGDRGLFRRMLARAAAVPVFAGVVINLYVFHLAIELVLLVVSTLLVMLAVAFERERRGTSWKNAIQGMLAAIGLSLFGYVLFRLLVGWQDFDWNAALRKFALPVWLTVGTVPFVYVFSLYMSYESAFKQVNVSTSEKTSEWRSKLAVASVLHLQTADLAGFTIYWANRLSESTSFRDARRVVAEFKQSRRAEERDQVEMRERLKRFAGVDGCDVAGRRLDQREFQETKRALRVLVTAQMGWYRNRGGRYRPELLDMLMPQFERSGLPSNHGISLHVEETGQAWWAYRRTISGWYFAVGASAPPPDEWLYDGPEPPAAPPGVDPGWGERWGLNARNW